MEEIRYTRELRTTVMVYTYNALLLYAVRLGLTMGQVIDWAIVNMPIPDACAATEHIRNQHSLTVSKLEEEQLTDAVFYLVGLLIKPYLDDGMDFSEAFDRILEALESCDQGDRSEE